MTGMAGDNLKHETGVRLVSELIIGLVKAYTGPQNVVRLLD